VTSWPAGSAVPGSNDSEPAVAHHVVGCAIEFRERESRELSAIGVARVEAQVLWAPWSARTTMTTASSTSLIIAASGTFAPLIS
jgi:hypothetical protein